MLKILLYKGYWITPELQENSILTDCDFHVKIVD